MLCSMSDIQESAPASKNLIMKWANSEANYNFGRVVNIALILFFGLQFVWNPSVETSAWTYILCFALGAFFWSFAEYVLHRWVYHDNETLFAKGHGMHHDEPLALLGMPWIVYGSVLLGIFWLNTLLTPAAETGMVYSGFWTGYFAYTIVHHGIHHWNLDWAWFKALKRHHKVHHKMADKNLGVTTIFWDRAFRTRI